MVKKTSCQSGGVREVDLIPLVDEDPLEKEMATHTSIFGWEIPWTEESGKLTVHGITESETTEAA